MDVSPQRFESKRDLWLVLILWISALCMIFGAIVVWVATPGVFAVLFTAVMGGSIWLVLSTVYSTYYEVGREEIDIRSSLFRWKVRLSEIKEIRPSNDPLSSPAVSLDRLAIRHGVKTIMVSPLRREEFLDAVLLHAPQLMRSGDSLVMR